MEGLSKMRAGILLVFLVATCVFGVEEMQTWVLEDGTTFKARFTGFFGKAVVMENDKGKQVKISLDRFSAEDCECIELKNPPSFNIDFRKKSKLRQFSTRFGTASTAGIPVVHLFTFGARVGQTSAGSYNHEITVEFFAIGAQRHHNNKYILLDHQTSSFIPSKEKNRSFEFWSPRIVELEEYAIQGAWSSGGSVDSYETRGKKYDTYLIIISDKNGKIIETKSENKWPLENLENLRKLSVGNFMDTTCMRVYPGRPKAELY